MGALILAAPLRGAELVRLAIVPEETALNTAADLLTARLSTNNAIALLERTEIEKIYQEQALSAANRDYLKMGRLLHADGLLILRLDKEAETPLMTVRLVAVQPGVTLCQSEYPFTLADPVSWGDLAAAQLNPWLPKLTVLPGDAVPISILNLRSAVASADSEALERELTLLLYNRLIREKDVFVLERRRLEFLTDEKDTADATENTFWHGSYLLEGVLDPKGFNQDTVAASIRLSPPDKTAVVTLDVSGPRTNLPAVINDLALRILGTVKKNSTPAAWNPQAEAGQYLAEAQWMFKWKMFPEAAAASESAWALGRQTAELAQLRVNAWQEFAGDPGVCIIQNPFGQVVFGQRTQTRVFNTAQIGTFVSAPGPERFAAIVRASELYASAFRVYARPDPKLDGVWLGIGTNLLNRASWWLRFYYFNAEARSGREDKIAKGRQLCREITAAISSHPGFATADTGHDLLTIKARHAALWVDSPEQALSIYREILESGDWPMVRVRFLDGGPFEITPQTINVSTPTIDAWGFMSHLNAVPANAAHPCLAGWNWEVRRRCPALWQGFIEEMCRSSKPFASLEGEILRCSYSWSQADFREHLAQLLQQVQGQRDALAAAKLDGKLVADLEALLNQHVTDVAGGRHDPFSDQIWTDFKRNFQEGLLATRQAAQQAAQQAARQAKLEARKKYLQTQTNFDFISFAPLMLNGFDGNYTPDEARELLPLLTNYQARMKAAAPGPQGAVAASVTASLEQKLKAAISPPPLQTNRPAASLPQSQAMPPGLARRGPPGGFPRGPNFANVPGQLRPGNFNRGPPGFDPSQATAPADDLATSNALEVSHFWKIPASTNAGPNSMRAFTPEIKSACFRDGKLWVEAQNTPFGDQVSFFGLDLATFTADCVQFRGDFESGITVTHQTSRPPFEVDGDHLYLALGDSVTAWSFKERTWSQLPLPSEGHVILWRLADRLFFTTANSILERNPDGSFRVLASSRRRPSLTPLDDAESYAQLHLFLTANGTLHATLNDDVYALPTGSNQWQHIGKVPNLNWSSYHPFDDGFIALNTSPPRQSWGMLSHSTAPELLFGNPPLQADSLSGQPASAGQTALTPRWLAVPAGDELCLEGESVWSLANPPAGRSSAPAKISLTHFKAADPRPITIPVRFASDDAALESARLAARRLSVFLPTLRLIISTPQGLVAMHEREPGFWFIPKADLQQALAQATAERDAKAKVLPAKP